MANLFASLNVAAGALRAFEQQISVSQNNVNNATTPGYAKQIVALEAQAFQPDSGMIGGVVAGDVSGTRSLTAEHALRQQLSSLASFDQQANILASIEGHFGLSGDSAVLGGMQRLFDAFADFAQSPDSAISRTSVMAAAHNVAESLNQASTALNAVADNVDAELESIAREINEIGEQLRAYNESIARSGRDPGLEARAFAQAEALSELVDTQILIAKNGMMTVLIGGEAALVNGEELRPIEIEFFTPAAAPNPGARSAVRLLDADGRDITAVVSQGRLGGLLEVRNEGIAPLIGDAQQEGQLNALARGLADRVNEILTVGLVTAGPPPVSGTPLFSYGVGQPTRVAATLQVHVGITPDLLAAISAGPPTVANGAALDLAELRISNKPQDQIAGMNMLEYYGSIASQVGSALKTTRQEEARASLLVIRAQDLRDQASAVSLDEEAVALMQAQRSFEASSRIVQVVDDLVQSVLGMVR